MGVARFCNATGTDREISSTFHSIQGDVTAAVVQGVQRVCIGTILLAEVLFETGIHFRVDVLEDWNVRLQRCLQSLGSDCRLGILISSSIACSDATAETYLGDSAQIATPGFLMLLPSLFQALGLSDDWVTVPLT